MPPRMVFWESLAGVLTQNTEYQSIKSDDLENQQADAERNKIEAPFLRTETPIANI